MEELIEYQTVEHGSPCEHWAYKEDSWGMWLSHVNAKRGGQQTGWGVALSSLVRFRYIVHKLEQSWATYLKIIQIMFIGAG